MKYLVFLAAMLACAVPASAQFPNSCYNCFSDGTRLYCQLLAPSGGSSCEQPSPTVCTLSGVCGGGPGGCFLMGTLVPTDRGLEAIEALSVGSVVRSVDQDGRAVSAKVVRTHRSIECGYYVINDALRVTGTHPFFVDGQWVEAANLKVGDMLLGPSGRVEIASIEKKDGVVRAYNITVDGPHTFLAGGVLVHNKPPDPNN